MEQLAPLLNELAAQLNTTVEFLWGVLVRQAFVSAIESIFMIVLLVILIFTSFRYIFPWLKKMKVIEIDSSADGGLSIAGMAVVWIVIAMGAFSIIALLGKLPTKLLNPEYWALQQILEVIK